MNKEILENIKKPYFKNIEKLGLNGKEKKSILSRIFDQPIIFKGKYIYNANGNKIYYEYEDYWIERKYNTKGNEISYETSDGFWEKREYNINDFEIYYENSNDIIIDKRK